MKANIGLTFAAARARPLIGFLVEQQAFALLLDGHLDQSGHETQHG
tara:strand:- start:11208 stop:11345 length:138 start_codon:yes stop_codon:yes gene_type:complete